MKPNESPWLNAFNAWQALCVLAGVGVYFAPINSHLQNFAYIIILCMMAWLFVREHKRIGTFGKKDSG